MEELKQATIYYTKDDHNKPDLIWIKFNNQCYTILRDNFLLIEPNFSPDKYGIPHEDFLTSQTAASIQRDSGETLLQEARHKLNELQQTLDANSPPLEESPSNISPHPPESEGDDSDVPLLSTTRDSEDKNNKVRISFRVNQKSKITHIRFEDTGKVYEHKTSLLGLRHHFEEVHNPENVEFPHFTSISVNTAIPEQQRLSRALQAANNALNKPKEPSPEIGTPRIALSFTREKEIRDINTFDSASFRHPKNNFNGTYTFDSRNTHVQIMYDPSKKTITWSSEDKTLTAYEAATTMTVLLAELGVKAENIDIQTLAYLPADEERQVRDLLNRHIQRIRSTASLLNEDSFSQSDSLPAVVPKKSKMGKLFTQKPSRHIEKEGVELKGKKIGPPPPLPQRHARFTQVFPDFSTLEELEEKIRDLPHLLLTYAKHFSGEQSHGLLPQALIRANELKEKVSQLPEDYVAGTNDYFARLQKVMGPRFSSALVPDPNNAPQLMTIFYWIEDAKSNPKEITALAILLNGISFVSKFEIPDDQQPLTQQDLDNFQNTDVKYIPTDNIQNLSQILSAAIKQNFDENVDAKRIADEERLLQAELEAEYEKLPLETQPTSAIPVADPQADKESPIETTYEKLPDETGSTPAEPAALPQKSPPEVDTKNKLEPNTTIYFNNDFPPKVAFVRIDNQWYKNNPVSPATIILEKIEGKPDDFVLDFYRNKTCFIDPTETWNESLDTKVILALGFPPRVRAGAQERAQFRFNIDKPGVREAINKAQAGNSKEDDTGFRLGDGRYRLIHNETGAEMRVLSDGRCLSSFIQTKKDNFDDTVNALLNIYEAQIRMGRAMAEHHYAETGEKLNLGVTTLFLVEERKRDGKPYTKEEKAQTEKLLAALDKGVRAILAKPENDIVKNAYKLEFEFEKVRYQRVHKKTDNYPLKFKAPEKKAEARMQAVPRRRGPGGKAAV